MAESSSNKMFIVVGPSGAGKSSFVDKATIDFSNELVDIITFTTRKMRKGEEEGNPYHFVDMEAFKSRISEDFFVEWAEVHGNLYGSPRYQMDEAWAKGKAVIMDVDVQGAELIKKQYPQCTTIFILPPSIDELRRRVQKRDGGVPKDLDLRMENAVREIALADSFDHQLINEDFGNSYTSFKKIIEETLKSR